MLTWRTKILFCHFCNVVEMCVSVIRDRDEALNAFSVWICYWSTCDCGAATYSHLWNRRIMFLSISWGLIKVCLAFWYPWMKDATLRWWMTVEYHHCLQDSRHLSIHTSHIQQWDFNVSTSLLTPRRSVLGTTSATLSKTFNRVPSSLVTAGLARLWLLWPTLLVLLNEVPLWTSQTFSHCITESPAVRFCHLWSYPIFLLDKRHRRQLKRKRITSLALLPIYILLGCTLGWRKQPCLSFHLYTRLHDSYLIEFIQEFFIPSLPYRLSPM